MTTYRLVVFNIWWRIDHATNHLLTWTGRRVAAAYDKLIDAEDRRGSV